MIDIDFSSVELQLKNENKTVYVFDIVRKKWLLLTPEEHVRQYFLHYLVYTKNIPSSLIAVERRINLDVRYKRFDIVVFDADHKPWMLVECKKPDTEISQASLFQLLNYQRAIACKYWVLTNGVQTLCADASDINTVNWMNELPTYEL